MKLTGIAVSLLALGLTAGSAFAASTTDTSTIQSIDTKAHQLTLADGKMFQLPSNWHLRAFKTGEKVRVSYDDHSGSLMVTKIRKA
jgi:Cu/Ag efflux protein CusF